MKISDNLFLLIFLIIMLVMILVAPHFTRCARKKRKFKKQLEHFVTDLDNKDTKVAIVTMVTKQPDFEYWLDYHLNHLKLDLIILRVEDSPEYKPLLEKYGDRVLPSYYNKEDIDMKHNYLTIMDRQKENVNKGIEIARERGIDYIFHTDADELIYVHPDLRKTHSSILLRKYLDEVPDDYSCIHFKNFEAVFPNAEEKCFNTYKFIDCKKGQCLSYANGKSAGRLNKDIQFHGPHYFSGKNHNMSDHKLAILHFDSCTYKQWETKFDLLQDTNEEKMKKIPFPFYKNSIKKMQKCGKKNKKSRECNEDLQKYYQEQKIDPYLTKNTREMKFN
jgi:hypothetical protein